MEESLIRMKKPVKMCVGDVMKDISLSPFPLAGEGLEVIKMWI